MSLGGKKALMIRRRFSNLLNGWFSLGPVSALSRSCCANNYLAAPEEALLASEYVWVAVNSLVPIHNHQAPEDLWEPLLDPICAFCDARRRAIQEMRPQ